MAFRVRFARGFGLLIVAWGGAAAAADISVRLDQAKLVKLPENVATVVVGNPSIADGSVQPGGVLVITGKGFGITNMMALDRAGTVLMEKTVEVDSPDSAVVVYRGIDRESYSCLPICEQRITPGDTKPYFDVISNQTDARNGLAQSASQSGTAQPGK
jgi:hypothetical protein